MSIEQPAGGGERKVSNYKQSEFYAGIVYSLDVGNIEKALSELDTLSGIPEISDSKAAKNIREIIANFDDGKTEDSPMFFAGLKYAVDDFFEEAGKRGLLGYNAKGLPAFGNWKAN